MVQRRPLTSSITIFILLWIFITLLQLPIYHSSAFSIFSSSPVITFKNPFVSRPSSSSSSSSSSRMTNNNNKIVVKPQSTMQMKPQQNQQRQSTIASAFTTPSFDNNREQQQSIGMSSSSSSSSSSSRADRMRTYALNTNTRTNTNTEETDMYGVNISPTDDFPSSPSSTSSSSSSSSSSTSFQEKANPLRSMDMFDGMESLTVTKINDADFQDETVDMKWVSALTGKYSEADSAAMLEGMDVEDSYAERDLPLSYDPKMLSDFFNQRPWDVLKRTLQIGNVAGGWISSFIYDYVNDQMDEEKEIQRTAELRDILTALGPLYIKIGQAISIRPDVLSPRAMVELQQLCDKVPPFDDVIAMNIVRKELDITDLSEIFTDITDKPVAAASLGQVYKGTLKSNGKIVAIKVQRPGVLKTVSLDLYLVRKMAQYAMKITGGKRTDFVALVDNFAERFYDELDYVKECENGMKMAIQMEHLTQVVIPFNYPKYTTRKVHVAEWLDGQKLSESGADDVRELVNVGVLAYLTQLLDTGFFHADPHPGNMLRTVDGKLGILDFGLMTEITDDQKYGLIEAIAHLIQRDYESIGADFQNLDFIPAGTDVKPIIPALANVFDTALQGGTAKDINFNELAADLAQISFDYPFRIPPFFALVIRAISVLEGIALVVDNEFTIIDEAYPYIAKRLLTDPSPRLRNTLNYMLYDSDGIFNVAQLVDLLRAQEAYLELSAISQGMNNNNNNNKNIVVANKNNENSNGNTDRAFQKSAGIVSDGKKRTDSLSLNRRDISGDNKEKESLQAALKFLFSEDGVFFREFITTEMVQGIDTISRDGAWELAGQLGLAPSIPDPLTKFVPKLTARDRKILDNTYLLLNLFGNGNHKLSHEVEEKSETKGFTLNPFEILNNQRIEFEKQNKMRQSSSPTSNALFEALIELIPEYGDEMREFGQTLVQKLAERLLARGIRAAFLPSEDSTLEVKRNLLRGGNKNE